ncbi:hypothetical protein EYF80_013757 [Liparis tanakae]|uniref:Uncharacterized protein n=1 Tax=Liparis tanakae TaxID=230148 RepID=A0A4Z2IEW8_9TELE|nr:hypothetical protein EYF80_013757 [Liparis tanakae]
MNLLPEMVSAGYVVHAGKRLWRNRRVMAGKSRLESPGREQKADWGKRDDGKKKKDRVRGEANTTRLTLCHEGSHYQVSPDNNQATSG